MQLKAENFSDVIPQVTEDREDGFVANIWHIHLLWKWRPTPCVLDKITRCAMQGGTAGVKEEPPVQGKAKGIAGEVLPPALVRVLRVRAIEVTVPTHCALVPLFLCFR